MDTQPSGRQWGGLLPVRGLAAACLLSGSCLTAIQADDWPQWRGPNRDGAWTESGVLESLPADGLPVRWRAAIGPGWSSPVVAEDKVFVTDVDLQAHPTQERVHCLDEGTGQSLWTYAYDVVYPDWALNGEFGSPPAATPAVDAGRLYMIGGNGHVHCLEAQTGQVVWDNNLQNQFEIKVLSCRPSPLIDGDLLILLTGGAPGACAIALDKHSGKLVWTALDESVSNSSPIVITAGGQRQLIVWTGESVSSLAPATGETYWREPLRTKNDDSIATPVCVNNSLLVSGFMLDLHGEAPRASPRWQQSRTVAPRILSNTSTPLLRGDHIYSALTTGELVCLDAHTGEQVWVTDQVTRLKTGASIHLTPNGDTTWLFTDEGKLIRARLSPAGYKDSGRIRLLEPTSPLSGNRFAWVPPAYANRRVFARNDRELVCVSLSADQ